MKIQSILPLCGLCAALFGAVTLPVSAWAQASYTWTGGNSNWSTGSNWTPAAGSGGPGSSDTVNLGNLSSSSTITYDSGASGTVGTLNMGQTANNVTTTLSLSEDLNIATAGALYQTTGVEQITLNAHNLTIASGATLTLGSTLSSLNLVAHTAIAGTGSLIVNGTLSVAASSGTTANFALGIGAPLVLNSGAALLIDSENTVGARLIVNGNFTSNGATTIGTTSSDGNAANGTLYFQGTSTTISSGTTVSGFNGLGAITFSDASGSAAQAITLGTLFNFELRNNTSGTSGTPITAVKTVSSSAVSGGTINNAIDEIELFTGSGASYATLDMILASNLNLATGQTTPFLFAFATSQTSTADNIDLNGYTYDATTATNNAFAPTGTTAGSTQININNSAGTVGTFRAGSFNFSGADVGIGNGVILNATTAGATNNLGAQANGVTSVNAGSTFYYSGTGTASLTANRSIGGIRVGTGSSSSTLKLLSSITTKGDTVVNSGATLDLNSQNLLLASGANLAGTGAISNTGGGGGGISFSGGGGIRPGASGSVGNLTLGSGVLVSLATDSVSTFDIASASSFDQIAGGTVVNGGTLSLNFIGGFVPTAGQTFQLFNGTSDTGTFTNISSNLGGLTASFDDATGMLTVNAVPEPSSVNMSLFALLLGGWAIAFSGRARSREQSGIEVPYKRHLRI